MCHMTGLHLEIVSRRGESNAHRNKEKRRLNCGVVVVLISFEGVYILVKCIRFYTYNNVSNCVNTVNELDIS